MPASAALETERPCSARKRFRTSAKAFIWRAIHVYIIPHNSGYSQGGQSTCRFP